MNRGALVGILVLIVVVGGGYWAVTGFAVGDAAPGTLDGFTQCLTSKGAVMYGAYWCPHCQSQKLLFGSSVQYVNYVECDSRGVGAKPELCRQQGITGYPTWIIGGKRFEGEQSLAQLAQATSCALPE